MVDHEEERRKAEQARALDVFRPAGAVMVHRYLNRQQEVIGVTRDDLEDILSFDGIAALLSGAGMFFLSGATWLLVQDIFSNETFSFSPLASFCILAVCTGILLFASGAYMHVRKRGKIRKIFSQTVPTGSDVTRH